MYLTCTALVLYSSGGGFAQRYMEFEHLSFQQGVGSNWIFDIAEDNKGFVWFAGFSGLTRHDGLLNKHYTHLPYDSLSLSSNHVYRLMPLDDGRIICSTIGGGLSIYNPTHDNFERITPNAHPNLPTTFFTTGIRHRNNDFLYLAGRPRSILRFNPLDSLPDFKEFPLEAETENGYFRENKARKIFADLRDSLKYWIVGNFRIYSFDAGSNVLQLEMEFEQLVNSSIHHELILCVLPIDEDHLLLKLDKHDFHRYNLRTKEMEFLAEDPVTPPAIAVSICPSAKGGYWIGGSNGQLFFAQPDFDEITEIHIEKADINRSHIECIYETHHGELYIGTNGAGVLKYHPSSNRFRVIRPELAVDIENSTSLNGAPEFIFIRGMLHPKLPLYYTNSYNWPGKLFLFDLLTERMTFLNTTSDVGSIEHGNFVRGPNNQVVTHNGAELFETDDSGKNLLPFNWTNYGGIPPELPNDIRQIKFADDGRLFIAGRNFVHLIKPDTQHAKSITKESDLFTEIFADILFEQSRVILLIQEAVFDWDIDNNELIELQFTGDFSPEIKAMRGYSETSHGTFITSALHGVIHVERKSDNLHVLRIYSQPQDIVSNNIYTSQMDSEGYIWLSTDLGFERFDPEGKSRARFGYRQNLPRLYRDNPFFINDSGMFASHGYRDLVYGRIEELLHIDTTGNLIIHTFEADGKNVLAQDLQFNNGISLQHKQNNLIIGWSHTQSSSSDFYLSEYMLRGFDVAYQSADNEYRAYYTNVPPGDYHFEISIRSAMDGSEIHHLSMPVSIAPPWWDTAIFKLMVALVLLLVVFGFFRLRLNAVRKEQALVSSYNQQLAEMEMQFLRAQMNPHFMFNSLNSIKHFILLNKKEEAVGYLTKFAQLIRSILQFSNLPFITLREELATLKTYVELEQARFSGGFDFEISSEAELDTDQIVIQPLILQPYVENAIWHGLMHKESNRKLNIVLSKVESFLVCEIIDNGIGREKSKSIRSDISTRKSMGLPISEKRMKSQDAESSVEITDIYDDDGKAAGTKVTLRLPFKYRND